MDSIQLVDAAKFYRGFPHQAKAWENLQSSLSEEQLSVFADEYRTSPPVDFVSAQIVTADQCSSIFGRDIDDNQLKDLNNCLERFAIDTPQRVCHFMAQVGHESGGLQWLEEIWGPTPAQIGYEGRRDLGNTEPGDGQRFKGAGAIQLTGRFNYEQFAEYIGDIKVMEGYAYVAEVYPFTSAGFWWHNNQINKYVDQGASCRRISQLVNGRDPANGLEDREAYFAKSLKAIKTTFASKGSDNKNKTATLKVQNPLSVPYFSQLDSMTMHADRMCQSSSNAMLLKYLKPQTLHGKNGDDEFLNVVLQYGDTVEPVPQVKALDSFGIKATRVMNADFSTIEEQIDRGIPVPCGFLHRGPIHAPTGFGHWLCVIGYTEKAVIVHDPNGDLDLLSGQYLSTDGEGLLYSRKNFGRRWMVHNDGSFAPGHGWAMIVQ